MAVLEGSVEDSAVAVMISALRTGDHRVLQRGKCRGSSVNWYPVRSNGEVQYAKSVCHGTEGTGVCPVLTECLEYALKHDEFGVWGGTSERERRRMKAARRLRLVS